MLNIECNIMMRLFTEGERKAIFREYLNSPNLVNALNKLLTSRLKQTLPKEVDLDKDNYPYRRAFMDGRGFEIMWLRGFLNYDKDDNEGNKDTI